MNIGIVVDNPNRDLDYCTLLALELVSLGHKIVLLPSNLIHKELPYLELDHIILNYVRNGNVSLIKKLHDCGISVSILETEGGLVNDDSFNRGEYPTSDEVLNNIFRIFCWGSKFYDYYLKNNPLSNEKVALSGTPKSDFWHNDFEFYLKSKGYKSLQNIGIKTNEKYFIVNTNFTTINSVFNTVGELRDFYINSNNMKTTEIDEVISEEFEKQKDLINTTIYLAKNLPAIKFIFRPHPFEDETTYVKEFEQTGLTNIIVSKKGLVNGLIAISLGVIHKSCSTGVEALLMNRNALSISFKNYKQNLEQVEAVSTHYDNKEAVLKKCIEIIESNSLTFQPQNVALVKTIEEAYYKIDGKAAKRIAKTIDDHSLFLANNLNYSNKFVINLIKKFANPKLYKLLLIKIFNKPISYSFIKFKDRYSIDKWLKSDKGFTKNNVLENVDILTTNYYKNLKVSVDHFKPEINNITPLIMASITIKNEK